MPAALRDGAAYSAAGVRKPPRKPRLGNGERCRRRYGDLRAAGELVDWDREGPTICAAVKRPMNERRVVSKSTSRRTICDGGQISVRALPWPVESRRA